MTLRHLVTILAVFIGISICKRVTKEYLSKGGKKFYFNSCSCGRLDIEEQDISSKQAKERNKVIENQLMSIFGEVRKKRDVPDYDLDLESAWDWAKSLRSSEENKTLNVTTKKSATSEEHPRVPRKRNNARLFRTLITKEGSHGEGTELEEDVDDIPFFVSNETEAEEDFGGSDVHKVINGIVADPGQAPWQVLLENMNTGEICGGSVLNHFFILTAAHCTEGFKRDGSTPMTFPKNILAIVRQPRRCSGKFLSKRYKVDISRVYDHPKYERLPTNELVFDFAILKTKKKMRFSANLKPICLPPRSLWSQTFENIDVKISGYGRTTKHEVAGKDTTSCVLKLGMTQIIPSGDKKCRPLAHHPDNQLCGWDSETDACGGDSGGPLTFKGRKYENNIQIGVVSYGSSVCAHEKAAGVYGRLTRVMKWILLKIQSGECANM